MKLSAPDLFADKNQLRVLWDRVKHIRLGPPAFDRMISLLIPYTGSIKPRVLEVHAGYAKVAMKDSRRVRNHLRSIHAVALCNLAEYAGNLALAYTLPDGARFIVKRMSIDFLKKARGRIIAEGKCPPVVSLERQEIEVTCELTDASGVTVARAVLQSLVGPVRG